MYQAYDIKIRKGDQDLAITILELHDVDEITCSEETQRDGSTVITYRIRPYLRDDFDDIVNEFKQNGIQIL